MKKLSIEIPTSSEDITIGQFQAVTGLPENQLDDPVFIVSLFTNQPKHIVEKMKDSDVLKIYKAIADSLQDSDKPIRIHWTHDDVTYSLHPEMEAMTFGELVDAEKYFNEPENYHKGMAVLYRRQTKESKYLNGLYDIVPYTGTAETEQIFKEIPLSYFFGVRAFFLGISSRLETISHQFLTQPGTQTAAEK